MEKPINPVINPEQPTPVQTDINKEQFDRLQSVANQYGGYNDPQFKTATDTKYGAAAFDKFNTQLRGQYERMQNSVQPQPTQPVQAQPIQQEQPVQPQITTPKPQPVETAQTQQDYQVGVMKNLQEGYKNDPSLFKDYETYKKAYGYDTANQDKKNVVDAFWQSKQPKDETSIYATLKSGQTLQNKQVIGTPEYNKAKIKYDTFNRYNSMGNEQLLTELKN